MVAGGLSGPVEITCIVFNGSYTKRCWIFPGISSAKVQPLIQQTFVRTEWDNMILSQVFNETYSQVNIYFRIGILLLSPPALVSLERMVKVDERCNATIFDFI